MAHSMRNLKSRVVTRQLFSRLVHDYEEDAVPRRVAKCMMYRCVELQNSDPLKLYTFSSFCYLLSGLLIIFVEVRPQDVLFYFAIHLVLLAVMWGTRHYYLVKRKEWENRKTPFANGCSCQNPDSCPYILILLEGQDNTEHHFRHKQNKNVLERAYQIRATANKELIHTGAVRKK